MNYVYGIVRVRDFKIVYVGHCENLVERTKQHVRTGYEENEYFTITLCECGTKSEAVGKERILTNALGSSLFNSHNVKKDERKDLDLVSKIVGTQWGSKRRRAEALESLKTKLRSGEDLGCGR